jgi:hypothetical protein
MVSIDPVRTAVVAIDMHRGHLDPAVATLPLAADRCDLVIVRAAQLFAALRARHMPIVHVVTDTAMRRKSSLIRSGGRFMTTHPRRASACRATTSSANPRPKSFPTSSSRETGLCGARSGPLWELWGAQNRADMLDVLQQSYCVKFDFVSGSPGYVGDLFIIQGDALTGFPPVELVRDQYGKLLRVEYEFI